MTDLDLHQIDATLTDAELNFDRATEDDDGEKMCVYFTIVAMIARKLLVELDIERKDRDTRTTRRD